MKRVITMPTLHCLVVIPLLIACDRKPEACINIPHHLETVHEIRLESCSRNTGLMVWDNGYGQINVDSRVMINRFEEEGVYMISLFAYSKHGDFVDVAMEPIPVSHRYIDKIVMKGDFPGPEYQLILDEVWYYYPSEYATKTEEGIVFDLYGAKIELSRDFTHDWHVLSQDTFLIDQRKIYSKDGAHNPHTLYATEGGEKQVYMYWRLKSPGELTELKVK